MYSADSTRPAVEPLNDLHFSGAPVIARLAKVIQPGVFRIGSRLTDRQFILFLRHRLSATLRWTFPLGFLFFAAHFAIENAVFHRPSLFFPFFERSLKEYTTIISG
jgi:hypothetical protein